MHHASTFGRQLQSAIFNPEDTESASAVTTQPGIDHCKASAPIEGSEPGWNGPTNFRQSLPRPLTRAQIAFVEGIVRGETYKAAYRAAYPGDQYCAHACLGDLRLALLQILAAVTQDSKAAVSKPNRFRLGCASLSGADQLAKGIGKRVNWHGFTVGRPMPTADGLVVRPPLGVT